MLNVNISKLIIAIFKVRIVVSGLLAWTRGVKMPQEDYKQGQLDSWKVY